jgi:uncharacterized membrane protein YgcG
MIAPATTSRQQNLFPDRESFQEWKVIMRTSKTRARKFSSKAVKILMVLVFASMIGSISIAPAFGFYIDVPGVSISSGSGIDLAFPGGDCDYNDCGYYDDGGYYAGGGYGGGYGGGGYAGGGGRGGGHRGGGGHGGSGRK